MATKYSPIEWVEEVAVVHAIGTDFHKIYWKFNWLPESKVH